MFDKQWLAALEGVTREALNLYEQERAAGGAEDETKWAELEDRADSSMRAIDEQLAKKEADLDQMLAELDEAIEQNDVAQMGVTITKLFGFWH